MCPLVGNEAFITIAKRWKQPTYPPMDERITRMWCTCARRSIGQPFKGWESDVLCNMNNLEDVMLSEIGQSQRDRDYVIPPT